MDIAPTILDMIDANVNDHHFMGNSIFSEKQSPVYLIQPYGKHLSVVYWPYKFLWHGRTGDIRVFDLKNDPNEMQDVYHRTTEVQRQKFMDDLSRIYLIQKLYKNNEVFKNK